MVEQSAEKLSNRLIPNVHVPAARGVCAPAPDAFSLKYTPRKFFGSYAASLRLHWERQPRQGAGQFNQLNRFLAPEFRALLLLLLIPKPRLQKPP